MSMLTICSAKIINHCEIRKEISKKASPGLFTMIANKAFVKILAKIQSKYLVVPNFLTTFASAKPTWCP